MDIRVCIEYGIGFYAVSKETDVDHNNDRLFLMKYS